MEKKISNWKTKQNKSKGTKEDHLEQEVTLVVDLQHGTARRS